MNEIDDYLYYEFYFTDDEKLIEDERLIIKWKLIYIMCFYFLLISLTLFLLFNFDEIYYYYKKFKKIIYLFRYKNKIKYCNNFNRLDKCSICLDNFVINKVLKLECNHFFHKDCIYKWLNVDLRCPLCRK